MFNGIKAVIFDLDGTLMDTVGMYDDVDRQIVIEGNAIPGPNMFRAKNRILEIHNGPGGFIEYAKFLKSEYNLPFSVEEIDNMRRELVKENCLTLCYKPNADVFLKELKKRGFILALATISHKWQVEIYKTKNENIMKTCDFNEIFGDYILTRDDVVYKKPSSEIYIKMLNMLKLKPCECLAVEDSLHGVQSAVGAGIPVLNIYDKYSDIDRDFINGLSEYTAGGYDELIERLNSFTRKRIK